MKVHMVVDIGNTRIKWGRCTEAGVVETAALPAEDRWAWQQQWAKWGLTQAGTWAIASVNPQRSESFTAWLREQGAITWTVKSPEHLPLQVDVEYPERVGIDRLLNA